MILLISVGFPTTYYYACRKARRQQNRGSAKMRTNNPDFPLGRLLHAWSLRGGITAKQRSFCADVPAALPSDFRTDSTVLIHVFTVVRN